MIPQNLNHDQISEIVSEVYYLLGTEGEIRNKVNPTPQFRKIKPDIIKEVEREPIKRIVEEYDLYMDRMNF